MTIQWKHFVFFI